MATDTSQPDWMHEALKKSVQAWERIHGKPYPERVPYPGFCRTPEECVGRGFCPKEFVATILNLPVAKPGDGIPGDEFPKPRTRSPLEELFGIYPPQKEES